MDFKNLTIEKLEKNTKALEKMLMAYWLSIPSDNDSIPIKIQLIRISTNSYKYDKLNRENVVYGRGSIRKKSIETYIDKVKYMNEQNEELFESTQGGKHYGKNNRNSWNTRWG